jgi:YjbE family integral membrane protein
VALSELASVVMIDVVLAGDNAIAVAASAAGLPPPLRRRAIGLGTVTGAGLRVLLALVATRLLDIIGLTLAGGLLLLFVAWKLHREFRFGQRAAEGSAARPQKTLKGALFSIIAADVSMSLDNVLAVAGAARDNALVLAVGLLLAVALMAVASNILARAMERYRAIGWVGAAVVAAVALRLIYDGGTDVFVRAFHG